MYIVSQRMSVIFRCNCQIPNAIRIVPLLWWLLLSCLLSCCSHSLLTSFYLIIICVSHIVHAVFLFVRLSGVFVNILGTPLTQLSVIIIALNVCCITRVLSKPSIWAGILQFHLQCVTKTFFSFLSSQRDMMHTCNTIRIDFNRSLALKMY